MVALKHLRSQTLQDPSVVRRFHMEIEPVRKILARLRGHFVQGKAVDLVLSERLIEVETIADGKTCSLYIPFVHLQLLAKSH